MIFPLLLSLVLAHIGLTWALAVRRGWRARQNEIQQPLPGPEKLPPVSVIVPAWNEKGTIENNIAALRQVNYPCWEVIVLAGGEDGTHSAAVQSAAGDGQFRILERGPEPKNAALNRGVQAAKYDIVVLLDADNMVEPDWLAALIAPIASGASVSVGHSFPKRITWITLEERMWHIYTYQILKLSWIQGDRSIAIRRGLLEQIGGLPIHTYAREDWDIWARLGETGACVVFAEGAHLTTDRPATLKESWRHQLRWRRTHLSGLWEHHSTLMQKPKDLFSQIYSYLLSAFVGVTMMAGLVFIILQPASLSSILKLFTLGVMWLCGRRAAVAGSVAAYTGDWEWVFKAWMPAFNALLLVPASVVALLSPARLTPLYKGPRHSSPLQNQRNLEI